MARAPLSRRWPELPAELMEAVVARVLTKVDRERRSELELLAGAHPAHAAALHQIVADLDATERILAGGFTDQPQGLPPRFGDYDLERELGRGGMGVVYAAVQRTLGRRVALKVLSAPLLADARSLARFTREARLLAQLEHPGIVRVIDAGTAQGAPFYAMEYVDGAPLSAVVVAVRRQGLPAATGASIAAAVAGAVAETEAGADAAEARGAMPRGQSYVRAIAELGAQVAEALAFAHAAGVIHRDVKPSNVLVRRDGTAVLTDFGIARLQSAPSLTVTGGFAGTPFYVSPEQARGAPVDHRTDVFSLGVMLYELLTLVRPFAAEDTNAVLIQIQRQEPRDPRRLNHEVPEELSAIVLKALAKQPAHRYAGAGALAADLRAFLEGRPVAARPPTRGQRFWRWCKREPWQAAALGTAAAAAAVLTASSLSFTERLLAENASTKAALVLAEENFAQATLAVDEMLTRVGERDLADVPQMETVRRDLLQRALAFYETFAAARREDRNVRFQLAVARTRVAWIRRHLNEDQAAIDAALAAIAELDALRAAAPDDPRVVLERAEASLTLATARESLGDVDGAHAAAADVIASLESLHAPAALELQRRQKIAFARYTAAELLRFRDTARARPMLEHAAGELAWLSEQAPDNTAIAARLANARITLSRIAQSAGDGEAAAALLRQADADLQRAPAVPQILALRCSIHDTRAIFHKDSGRLPEAVEAATAGVEAWRELAAAFPNTPGLRRKLGLAWNNLGNFRRYLDHDDAAIAATREAIAVFEALVESLPDVVEYRAGLARALLNLASMLVRGSAGEARPEGRAVLERALAVAERLRSDDPDNAEHARLVADCLGESAFLAGAEGDHDLARQRYERAAQAWGDAAARHPQNTSYRDGQANMQRGAARELLELDDPATALAVVDQSLVVLRDALASDPRHPTRRRFTRNSLILRADACAKLGDHPAACAALAELTALADSERDSFDAAAIAAAFVPELPAAARDGYVDAALAALSRSIERGYKNAGALASDARFAGVRDHPRFLELQRRIAQ